MRKYETENLSSEMSETPIVIVWAKKSISDFLNTIGLWGRIYHSSGHCVKKTQLTLSRPDRDVNNSTRLGAESTKLG